MKDRTITHTGIYHMQRIRGMVMGGIRSGHSKDSIIHDLRHSHISTTEPHVLAYIDGVFDTIEALGVEC